MSVDVPAWNKCAAPAGRGKKLAAVISPSQTYQVDQFLDPVFGGIDKIQPRWISGGPG